MWLAASQGAPWKVGRILVMQEIKNNRLRRDEKIRDSRIVGGAGDCCY
jgi:hypothetical protein